MEVFWPAAIFFDACGFLCFVLTADKDVNVFLWSDGLSVPFGCVAWGTQWFPACCTTKHLRTLESLLSTDGATAIGFVGFTLTLG